MTGDIVAATRIVFMGTPDFAVPSLTGLVESGATHQWEVVAVYTQPDRRAGRGNKVLASAVKQTATELGICVSQPESLRKDRAEVDALASLAPDLLVVAAYGMILPPEILEIPIFGAINVHASLLPAYRGASPINAAILDGLTESGVSIMLMDEGLDTGPVLAQSTEPIYPTDTAADLSERLSHNGAQLLLETIPEWLAGELAPVAQDELAGEPTQCRTIKKRAGLIDWHLPAAYIERMARAYFPWPSAYTYWRGEHFKIIKASVVPGQSEPGLVQSISTGVAVGTGDGLLQLHEVQPAGKRVMTLESFLNGTPDFINSRLGNLPSS